MEAQQMTFGVVLAARMSSKRLAGKAMLPLMGLPVITLIIRRLKTSKNISEIIFATTRLDADDELAATAKKEGVEVFRGATENVLSRYVEAASGRSFNYVVRVTGDCPFVDGTTLDRVIESCRKLYPFDLVTTKPAYPHGIDYEVYPKKVLEDINKQVLTSEEREHHLNCIYKDEEKYKICRLEPPAELKFNEEIFLLDTPDDYSRLRSMTENTHDIFVSPADLIKRYAHAN